MPANSDQIVNIYMCCLNMFIKTMKSGKGGGGGTKHGSGERMQYESQNRFSLYKS